jgi:hypothetical protein
VVVDYVRVPSGEAINQLTPSLGKFDLHPPLTDTALPMKQLRSILAYDAEWHYSDITEQHAFSQVDKLLPEVPGVFYFGFPWATLIERLNSKQSTADSLKEVLRGAKFLLNEQKSVVTVCQHVDMLKYQEIFKEIGVTHVFWTHAVRGQDCFPENGKIKILPFPVFPVQVTAYASFQDTDRKYLYSFIEPKSKGRVTGKATGMILDTLTGKQDGLVFPRVRWDFNNVLRGTNIQGEGINDQALVDCAAPIEVGRILRESIFSICPTDSGSNSRRLWESIGCGSIPVVLSDNYLPPGSKALWELATVSCPERQEDTLALPDRLAAMARDKELLDRKRHAMRQLWMIYGPDCFIYDIQKLFLSFASESADIAMAQPQFSYGSLYGMAGEINRVKNLDRSVADIFILGCSSRILFDSSGFLNRFKRNNDFRTAYRQALCVCGREYADSMLKALELRNIDLEHIPCT